MVQSYVQEALAIFQNYGWLRGGYLIKRSKVHICKVEMHKYNIQEPK